jgi:hypothetical protein
MKQHNFDNWVKEDISSFEKTKKPEWNKNDVYEKIIMSQGNPKIQFQNRKYWIAAVILILIFLNIFQFSYNNSINEEARILSENKSFLDNHNNELAKQLENSMKSLAVYESNIDYLSHKIKNNESTIAQLESFINNIKPTKEIQYLTEYVYDTVYIEKYIEEEKYIADNEPIETEFQSKEIIQFVSSFKPLVTQKNNQENKLRIKIGSDDSKYGHTNNEHISLISTEL